MRRYAYTDAAGRQHEVRAADWPQAKTVVGSHVFARTGRMVAAENAAATVRPLTRRRCRS
jgi:hypothetical protein